MLRGTLILFVGFVLLVLSVTVGYALLGLSGPRTAIADADRALADHKVAEAVRLLDIAERTLTAKEHTELLPAILQRRFQAHRKLDNIPAARRDVETLLELLGDKADAKLGIEHLEILLAAEEPEAALEGARRQLAGAGDRERPRLLEIAGQAHQALYQRGVVRLIKALEPALPTDAQRQAVALLKTLLYRAADDRVAQYAQTKLQTLLRDQATSTVSFDGLLRGVAEVRTGIQEALTLFRECLESEHAEPDAAYRGVIFALEQVGRLDEKRAVEDLYLRRFHHPATVQAAILAAEDHFAAGRFALAAEVARQYMPLGSARTRAEQGRFPLAAKRLLVTHARALHALGDRTNLARLTADVAEVERSEVVSMVPEIFLINALNDFQSGGTATLEQLKTLFWKIGNEPPRTAGAPDLYRLGVELQLEWHRAHGNQAQASATLDEWIKARPGELRPRRQRCEYALANGQPELALVDASVLLKDSSRDDATLALYVRAADQAAVASGRDAAQLFGRLAARGSATPIEPHDPAIYLALGELAMKAKAWLLAARCGELAARSFAWAEWPRRMAVEASLQLGPVEALHAAETYREAHPESPTALLLYRQALEKAERDEPALAFDIARHGVPDRALARTLLTSTLARGDRLLLPGLCQRAMFRYGNDARVTLLAARGMLVADKKEAARDVLLRIPAIFPTDHAACLEAARRFLLLEAKTNPASPLLPLAVETLRAHARGDAETLTQVASELEEAGLPALVLAVLDPLLNDEAYRSSRNGQCYALAGRACIALEKTVRAEEYLMQALGFPDGAPAASTLTMLLVLQKRKAEAESALWQQEAVDEASACLLLSLNRSEAALRWARNRLRDSSLDVTAMLVLAHSGTDEDKRSVPNDFRTIARTESKALLETITLLAMPGFQVLGARAAHDLYRRLPASSIARFLYARSLALVGKRDAAVVELTELTQSQPGFLPAYDEVLRITEGGLRGDITAIGPRISNSVMEAPNLATPRMRAMVGQALASRLGMASNDPGSALPMLARLWIQFPQESRVGLENVATLTTRGRTEDAFELLRQLETQLPSTERSRFLEFYFALGRHIARTNAEIESELDARARRILDTEAPFGAAVHHIVDRLEKANGPFRANPESAASKEAEAMLARHLDFVPTFRDHNVDMALRTLDRLQEIESPDQVLTRIDQLLRRDPSLLRVWMRRAQLLEARGDIDEALASLRWIFDYTSYDPALLEFARIAGLHDRVSKKDQELIASEVTATVRARPEAPFPLAMVAMRTDAMAEAEELLAKAPRQADGAPVFYEGLLALRQQDRLAAARQAFTEVAERYPASPHRLWAKHLAAQVECLESTGRPPANPR